MFWIFRENRQHASQKWHQMSPGYFFLLIRTLPSCWGRMDFHSANVHCVDCFGFQTFCVLLSMLIVCKSFPYFPNQACLWGSYSLEISVRVPRESGSPVTQERFPQGCQMENLGTGKSRKSWILPPWDWGRKTRFSNGLAHNRTKASGSWAEIDGVHMNFWRSIFPFISKNHESGWN